MTKLPILNEVVVILGLSVLIILLFQKLRIPAILGLLFTGAVAGPHGLRLISASHEVELMSEIGVVFLLFVIGIEFSLKGLSSVKNTVFWGGLVQVGGTIALTVIAAIFLELPWEQSIFLGFLLSLSSTAIVLKILQERGEIRSPHGNVTVAILIFQDIIVVPMMLVTPILAGQSENPVHTLLLLAGKVILILSVVIVMAKYLVPGILRQVVATRSKDLFILTIVVICFATAWLTSSVGLSLALGAFFAGLIISESDYSHQATANILPFREIFMSFFFVSIGMLLDLQFFIQHFFTLILLTLAVIIGKALIAMLAVFLLRYPPRTIVLTALSLFQVGEFSFLLSTTGMQYQLLDGDIYQYFLAISVMSMAATPFVMNAGERITDKILNTPIPRAMRFRFQLREKSDVGAVVEEMQLSDHIVIIGYGINGQNVARAARYADLPYLIIELDPEAIKIANEIQEPVLYGDAVSDVILEQARVHEARVIVVAISDPAATKNIIRSIRMLSETAYVIVRTRSLKEIDENLKLGADEVIPEEFETSIEIFSRTLKQYLVPADKIKAFTNEIRSDNYDILRNIRTIDTKIPRISAYIPDMEIVALHVQRGRNAVVGRTIGESSIRTQYGVTVLAIKRNNAFIYDINPEVKILQDDIVYIFGDPSHVAGLNKLLEMG
jgi:CPA2 family monovalent cation:H+ antiporter-2